MIQSNHITPPPMPIEKIVNTEHNFTVSLHLTEEGHCCCPVCGDFGPKMKEWRPYNEMGVPSYDICYSCGFQYGYDDGDYPGPYDISWASWRKEWFFGRKPEGRTKRFTMSQKLEMLKRIGIEEVN